MSTSRMLAINPSSAITTLGGLVLLADDVHAKLDALIADEDRRPGNELAHVMLALSAERAVESTGQAPDCPHVPEAGYPGRNRKQADHERRVLPWRAQARVTASPLKEGHDRQRSQHNPEPMDDPIVIARTHRRDLSRLTFPRAQVVLVAQR